MQANTAPRINDGVPLPLIKRQNSSGGKFFCFAEHPPSGETRASLQHRTCHVGARKGQVGAGLFARPEGKVAVDTKTVRELQLAGMGLRGSTVESEQVCEMGALRHKYINALATRQVRPYCIRALPVT